MVARRRRRSSRNPTTIPAGRPRWTAYYDIDPSDPPTIAQVAEAWTRDVKARESTSAMAWYSLAEILRSADPGNYLREMPGTAKARAFKASVKRRGITEPVMLEIDRDGHVKVGEGNHRINALMTLHPRHDVMVPVRFVFDHHPHHKNDALTWRTFNDPSAAAADYERRYGAEDRARAARKATPANEPRHDVRGPADDAEIEEIMRLLGASRNPPRRRAERNGENVYIKVVDEGSGFTVWLHTDRQYDEDGELIFGKIEVEEPRRDVDKWCERNVGKLETKVRRSLDVLVAHNTRLHPSLWHRGLGLAMYIAALKHAAARPHPAAIIADACTGGTTSDSAADTWERLRKVPGVIVAGTRGGIDDSMRTYAAFWVGA